MRRTHGYFRYLVLIFLPFSLLALSTARTQTHADTSAVGLWQGTLDVGGTKLRIVFHIASAGDNVLRGTLDSPDQGATGIPVNKVTVSNDSALFEVATIGGAFKGRFSVEKGAIEGTWSQGAAVLPLLLTRTNVPIEVKRPQEPKPPFPYRVEEVSYENADGGVKLAGTLTLPGQGGPFPAVLLITGSGPQDRDEALFGHKPFLVIADYLTNRGIAVLRVDDRGIGGSTGGISHATTADFASDVQAGIRFLKNRRDIDSAHIGLIGHSEGGIIAPMVATRSKDVAFIVMLAATALRGDQVLQKQLLLIEQADSVPAAKVNRDLEQQKKVFSMIETGKDSAALAEELRAYLQSTVTEWGAELKKSGIDPEKSIENQIRALLSPWFRYFLSYDPVPVLRKLNCPVLAMGGTLDLQVAAKENLDAIEVALGKAGNTDCTTRLFTGLNHLFQHAKTGSPKEYGHIEETFAPEALKEMGDWIAKHVKK